VAIQLCWHSWIQLLSYLAIQGAEACIIACDAEALRP